MALFEEAQIENTGEYAQIALKDLEVGDSIGFMFFTLEDRHSEEFGDFQICAGVSFDVKSKSLDAAISTAQKASFVPNTMLQNLLKSKGMVEGGCYRIEKAWNRGDKYKGKASKGYGYNVFKLSTPMDFTAVLEGVWTNDDTPPLAEEKAEAKRPSI